MEKIKKWLRSIAFRYSIFFMLIVAILVSGFVTVCFFKNKNENEKILQEYKKIVDKFDIITGQIKIYNTRTDKHVLLRDPSDNIYDRDNIERLANESETIAEAMGILMQQYDSFKSDVNSTIAIFAILISLFSIIIPIFNYGFLQKDTIKELENRVDNKVEEVKEHIEIIRINGMDNNTGYAERMAGRFKSNEANSYNYFLLGNKYENENQYEKAINAYTNAIIFDSNFANAYFNRGFIHSKIGQRKEAIRDYAKAIELDPNDAMAYHNRGNTYYYMGKYEKAIRDYTKVIKLNPDDTAAYNNRGSSYVDMKDHEEAIRDYAKAIELDPNYAMAYHNLAELYINTNKLLKAQKILSQALDKNDENPRTLRYLSVYWGKVGVTSEALKFYNRAIECGFTEEGEKTIEVPDKYFPPNE